MASNIVAILDSAAGKAQKSEGESLTTFLASLTSSGIILGIGLIAYIFLKAKLPEYYFQQRRRASESEWRPISPSSWTPFWSMPYSHTKYAAGLDNYFFDRYLHTVTRIFLLLGLTVPPSLIPLNIINGRNEAGGVRGLDRLSFTNISLTHTDRYWAHLVMANFVVILVCYILRLELQEYTRVQDDLSSSKHCTSRATSLLLVSSSKQRLSIASIRRRFNDIAGGIHTLTINRDYRRLHAKLRQRDLLVNELEIAETNLIIRSNTQKKSPQRNEYDNNRWTGQIKERQLTRLPLFPWLPSLPMVGRQVDTIHHYRRELAQCNLDIVNDQSQPSKFSQSNSVFLYFHQRIPTNLASLAIQTRIPPSWSLKQGITPEDTVWPNITISWWEQYIRTAVVYALVALLTLGFAFPVTVIGSLSQINYLGSTVSWLHWLNALPKWLIGAIQGVLPPLMLALVTVIVPMAMRLLAGIQGLHSRQAIENHIQIYYFIFMFVQGFLTISLSAGITTIIGGLSDSIKAVPVVLAQNLPKASNYFFSYIVISTFTTIVSVLTQVSGLVNVFILSPLLDKTARQKWIRSQSVGLQRWGTFIPVFTNIACIGLIYSIIAPLILVLACIYFGVLRVLYSLYPPILTDLDLSAEGIFYPTAIRQLLTGIYIMELCLTGLFFLVRDADDTATCTAQGVIMIIAMVSTAVFHYALDHTVPWLSCYNNWKHKRKQVSKLQDWAKRRESRAVAEPTIFRVIPSQDDALNSPFPVVWVPKDKLGVTDNEICHIKRAYNNIWISSEGAFLGEGGKLKIEGDPPRNSQ